MVVGIIEFHIRPGADALYAQWAEKLHAKVHEIDGFISVERFESRTRPGTWLSVSYWRDAAALAAWRRDAEHLRGMAAGKRDIFADYRIVVATVDRDYSFAAAKA
ncbi:MAG: antibiotic biosynthesis monooxygenase [Rhodospirillaceae bacterium]|nr:antibiotic biosynthesis monooxygenase [Rhodospirillaceae bacterium]